MEFEAPLELVMEGSVRQRHDARSLFLRLGPYDRGTPALERQNRERAGRQKMFFGTALVIALMRDIDDDGRLIVAPAVGGDAGATADRRAGAVGGDQKPRCQRRAVGEIDIEAWRGIVGAGKPRNSRGPQLDA